MLELGKQLFVQLSMRGGKAALLELQPSAYMPCQRPHGALKFRSVEQLPLGHRYDFDAC